MPFLPKILSIAKALPLQIHPNKDLAAKLHAKNPEQFTDDNHKREIAIALGPFEVFAGWKPQPEIESLFDALPPLEKFLRMLIRAGKDPKGEVRKADNISSTSYHASKNNTQPKTPATSSL